MLLEPFEVGGGFCRPRSSWSTAPSWSSCSTRIRTRRDGSDAGRRPLEHVPHAHRRGGLAGIAAAGYKTVELSSVVGWTEHVVLDDDPKELYARLAHYGLEPTVLSAHSDLTTDEGVEYALKAIGWAHGTASRS